MSITKEILHKEKIRGVLGLNTKSTALPARIPPEARIQHVAGG